MSVKHLFEPTSIAIVGVSHEPRKVGHLVAHNIIEQGYAGELFFINKTADPVLGKTPVTSISEIQSPIDLALLAIPAEPALAYLPELAAKHVKAIVMYAAGFKEIGPEGAKQEEKLKEEAKKCGIEVLGPNCLGFINTRLKINATFLKHTCPTGNIGFVSQSGALGSVVVDYFVAHQNQGLSYFISLGNKAAFDESDALEYLLGDEQTEVIAMYLEDVKDGTRFRSILQKCAQRKPVVILKSGSTEAGSHAAISHTGGLVGDDQVFESVFSQAGAIRAHSFDEFMTLLKVFSFKRIPSTDAILVLSNAGGAGVLLADELIHNGLQLVTISEHTKETVAKAVGEMKHLSLHNPIDLLGDASAFDYKQAIASTIAERNLGAIIVLLTPQANTQTSETARVIATAQSHFNHPIYPVFMGEKSVAGSHKFFEERRVASFDTFDQLPKALAEVLRYRQFVFRSHDLHEHSVQTLSVMANEQSIKDAVKVNSGKPYLNISDSITVLQALDLPVEPVYLVTNTEMLRKKAQQVGFPLVAKIAADSITHKTEAKGVITDIKNHDELYDVYQRLSKIQGSEGAYLQKMQEGYELFLGAKRDANFGSVIVLGLGGIYAELLKEVFQLVFPFTFADFTEKLNKSKLHKFKDGFRGMPKLPEKQLYDMAVKLAVLLQRVNEIKEVDMNPVLVTHQGLLIVDSRIILS